MQLILNTGSAIRSDAPLGLVASVPPFLTPEILLRIHIEGSYLSIIFCNFRTVFQFLAVPAVFSFFSSKVLVNFERPIPSG
jgi:hypothetical protein